MRRIQAHSFQTKGNTMTRILPRILRTRPLRTSQPADPHDHPDLTGLTPDQLADLPRPSRIALTTPAQ